VVLGSGGIKINKVLFGLVLLGLVLRSSFQKGKQTIIQQSIVHLPSVLLMAKATCHHVRRMIEMSACKFITRKNFPTRKFSQH
jgi:hypothetical protein